MTPPNIETSTDARSKSRVELAPTMPCKKEEERLKNNTKVRDEEDKKLRALTAKKTELTDFIRKRDFVMIPLSEILS